MGVQGIETLQETAILNLSHAAHGGGGGLRQHNQIDWVKSSLRGSCFPLAEVVDFSCDRMLRASQTGLTHEERSAKSANPSLCLSERNSHHPL